MSQTTNADHQSGWFALFGTLAMAALVIAIVAVMLGGDDELGRRRRPRRRRPTCP